MSGTRRRRAQLPIAVRTPHRQVKAHLPDHKAEDPTHHGNARYTLKTTEDSIKSQRLVLDLKKKQAAEKAKQERQQSDGHLSEDKSNKGAGPTPDGDKKEGDKKDDKKKKDGTVCSYLIVTSSASH
jgi:hypothetical protein